MRIKYYPIMPNWLHKAYLADIRTIYECYDLYAAVPLVDKLLIEYNEQFGWDLYD